jgi:sugar phosphate permease
MHIGQGNTDTEQGNSGYHQHFRGTICPARELQLDLGTKRWGELEPAIINVEGDGLSRLTSSVDNHPALDNFPELDSRRLPHVRFKSVGRIRYLSDKMIVEPNPYESPIASIDENAPVSRVAPTGIRYLVIVLCMAMSVLLYLDRFALSPATDSILRELQLTKEEFGRTYFAFFFAYALLQVPAGWLSDHFGARVTLALYVVGWSLATVSLGLANGLAAILVLRLALGATQAGAYPAAASLLKRWIPAMARGRANTTVSMGGRAGGLIAFFCTPMLMLVVGQLLGWGTGRWRAVFVLYGTLGFIWAGFFWWLFRDLPRLHPWCNSAEVDLICEAQQRGRPRSRGANAIVALALSKEVWLLCAFNCAVNVGWIFLVSWLPQYLVEKHGSYLSEQIGDKLVVAGVMTALTGLAGMCGGLLGGATTDLLVRSFGLSWGRRLPGLCAGGIVCGLYLLAAQSADVWTFIGAMVAISFVIDFGLGASWASYQDIGGRHVASVLGIGNMCGNLGAAVFAWLIGWLAQQNHWQTVFVISAIAMAVNSVCWLFFDAARPIWKETTTSEATESAL